MWDMTTESAKITLKRPTELRLLHMAGVMARWSLQLARLFQERLSALWRQYGDRKVLVQVVHAVWREPDSQLV
jgi:hypothetical protein